MRPDEVTICIVHRNTPEWLGVALRRIARHTPRPRPRVIVVDNGSNAEVAKVVSSLCKPFGTEVMALPKPVPHGAALDAAASRVKSPWMLAMDSDAFPIRDGWLGCLTSLASDGVSVAGASAGMAHGENHFGNYVHPSFCLVDMAMLSRVRSRFQDAWPRWDTGEQITIDAMRLGQKVRYLPTTHFNLYGHGVVLGGAVFHAYYGTRLKVSSARELAESDGIDVDRLRSEHRRLLDAEKDFIDGNGPDPFAKLDEAADAKTQMSVIVPFRRRDAASAESLSAVLASLNSQTLERNRYEIVVVEAAPAPALTEAPPGCRLVFAYCPDAMFRKSWAMNVGFRQATGDMLVFHDADIIAPEGMLEAIAERLGPGCPAVKPSYSVVDTSFEQAVRLRSRGQSASRRILAEAGRLRNAPGGSIAVTRRQFVKVRGFNEKFVGWGGEDDEFLLRLRAHGENPPDLGCKLLHIWHEQGPMDQNQVAANRRLVGHASRLNKRAARRYAEAMPEGFGEQYAFRRRPAETDRAPARPVALLAGAYSRMSGPDSNAGDDATRDVLVSLLKRKGCSVRVSPKHPCVDGQLSDVDMVAIGGGGLIADHSEDAFYNYMSYLKHGAAENVPVAIVGVGVCRLSQKRRRVSSLMRGVPHVYVRDEMSRGHLEDGQFAEVASDLAWLLKPSRKPMSAVPAKSAAVFVVGNSYASVAKYRNRVHECVDEIVSDGLTPVLVVHAKDDQRAVPGFTRRYPDAKVLNYFSSKSNTPAALVAALARMSRTVTSRYHGIIFSALAGTPCRVIPGSPEKVGFLRDEIGVARLASKSELPGVVAEMQRRARKNIRALSDLASSAKSAKRPPAEQKVSVCMITLNDDAYIRRALANIPTSSQVGEILVVDGGSTDGTLAALESDGRVRLLHRPFSHDFSDQKNFCISQANHDWIVWLDADEAFPERFWESLGGLLASGHDAFWFPRENFIGNTPAPTNDVANDPDYQFRLFSKKCRWVGKVHENLTGYSGSPGKTGFVICHRKSRGRQDWNDQYYAWIGGSIEHRPSHEARAEVN